MSTIRRSHAVLVAAAFAAAMLAPTAAAATHPTPTPTPATLSNRTSTNLPAPDHSGKGTVTFGLGPATSKGVDTRSEFTLGASPGGYVDDRVGIVNIGLEPITLTVYAADATLTSSGAFTLTAPNSKQTGVGSWLQFNLPHGRSSVVVPGRSTLVVPFRLLVPANASPGDHSGGIVASLASFVKSKQGIKAHLLQRVGVRVFVRVGGPVQPRLAVDSVHTSYDGTWNPIGEGSATVTYRVRNVGNVNLGGDASVRITGLFHDVTAVHVPRVPLLLPGTSATFRVHVPGVLPQIFMHTRVDVQPLVPVGAVDPGLEQAGASMHFWAIPWVLLIVLAALISLILLERHRRRRRRTTGRHREIADAPQRRKEPAA